MDYNFTADIEKQFDIIAEGNLVWNKMIADFYGPFHQTVEETLEAAGRVRGRRDLGVDAGSGQTILTQMTRFGPVVQIGTREEMGEDEKPRFALPALPALPALGNMFKSFRTPSFRLSLTRKLILSLVVILIIVLLTGIFFFKQKQESTSTHALFQSVYTQAQQSYDVGKNLQSLNKGQISYFVKKYFLFESHLSS
jgi:hypothetical protein